jgi:phosphocarrier protein HPr
MYERRVTLTNLTGFHVRPATLFMEAASRFRSDIRVFKQAQPADGKSAISLMLLEAGQGTELIIQATGEDEREAVDALVRLVAGRFDENARDGGPTAP